MTIESSFFLPPNQMISLKYDWYILQVSIDLAMLVLVFAPFDRIRFSSFHLRIFTYFYYTFENKYNKENGEKMWMKFYGVVSSISLIVRTYVRSFKDFADNKICAVKLMILSKLQQQIDSTLDISYRYEMQSVI